MMCAMRVTINEDEEVEVGDDTREAYFIDDVSPVGDSVFKCPDCKTGTVHEGHQFTIVSVTEDVTKTKRIYCCTNCGKFSTK